MAQILAFFSSPLGMLLIKEVPDLVGQVFQIAHQKGLVKPEEILTYITESKTWEQIPSTP